MNLLSRSLGISPQTIRQIHLDLYSNSPKQSEDAGKSSEQQKKAAPNSSGASGGSAPGSSGGPNGNKNDNDDKIKSVLTKTIMWMFTIYMFVAFISLIMSPRTERPEV